MIGTVAQWLEQVTHNLRVAGSSPAGSTNPPHSRITADFPITASKKRYGAFRFCLIQNPDFFV